jgi:hypothetical protein
LSHFLKEGLWLRFLERVSLIDDLTVTCAAETANVSLDLVKLAHLRPEAERNPSEVYEVRWFFSGVERVDLKDLTEFEGAEGGDWEVRVKFTTSEIRRDGRKLTSASKSFSVTV